MKYRWFPPYTDSESKVRPKLICSLDTTEIRCVSGAKETLKKTQQEVLIETHDSLEKLTRKYFLRLKTV